MQTKIFNYALYHSGVFDQNIIDISIIVFAFIYNILIITIFILRANEWYSYEEKIGPFFDSLFIPFSILFIFNIANHTDLGRVGTIIPMILYLLYDIWYRQLNKRKPRHHPEKMPKMLILYIFLFYFAGMAITGYTFIVSKTYGYFILLIFMCSIGAYFYYQIKYSKKRSNLLI